MLLTRRKLINNALVATGSVMCVPNIVAISGEGDTESHGLSTFGDLALPENFQHFAYVNPSAPKGGTLTLQLRNTQGNQNFDTFDTFNVYSFKGDGAAGMEATFDSLMTGASDEPDALYGLLARKVQISANHLIYRFFLRENACFHDGSRVLAQDAAFSFMVLKTRGHPLYRALLAKLQSAEAEADDVVKVTFAPERSRDIHLLVAGLPVFSQKWWRGRDFEASTLEAPLGSGAYKLTRYEQGRFVEFSRVTDYWARDLPVNRGLNNFDRLRYEYYRERQVAFEAFKSGKINYNEEYTARFWATSYDFPAVRQGSVKREELVSGAPTPVQAWYFNTRRPKFADVRIRQAIGLCFDFEWTNKNIMFSAYKRTSSYFENTPMAAKDFHADEELALLEPFRGRLPSSVFEQVQSPPVSDGSGSDRSLLRKADELLQAAGCRRENGWLLLPDGKPFDIEFLDYSAALQPHTEPFQTNLKRLGITSQSRIVDAAQFKNRLDSFEFDMVTRAMGGSFTPGDELRNLYSSAAATTPGSHNITGLADPVIDALIEKIAVARSRAELNVVCRALDRILRASHLWVPMWNKNKSLIAYWDMFSRPEQSPKFATGAPGTWWYDAEKARRIGKAE